MRATTILPILLFLCMPVPVNADFAMLQSEKGDTPPATAASAPPKLVAKGQKTRRELKPPRARGFGNRIPLSFAIRQIVPSPVKVRFAREDDRGALVDWRGGRPWPSVLREAVRPLGLRAVVRQNIVSVTPR